MKCSIPEISWHNRDPVLCIDVQSTSNDGLVRLASGGTDSHVLIWSITVGENGAGNIEFLSDLSRHQRAVNAVRFSPNGEILASGDDEAIIILWTLKPKSDIPDIFANKDQSDVENKENWMVLKILRGHMEDVYDICWSPDNSQILSGSVDNTAILWDVAKGKSHAILTEHRGFVQGVAWDPKNQYVATLSSDRNCRIYSLKTKKVVQKISQATLKLDDQEKLYKLYHDDTLKTFCRRLNFSPDGLLLFTPCGYLELNESNSSEESDALKKSINATYAFARNNQFSKVVTYYPSGDRYSIVSRFCPVLFELRPDTPSMYSLPYRMVFAIATQNAILLYDTQQPMPFARIARIHYTRLTDVAWSSDGRILVVSSTDGYCSIVTFSEDELGVPYKIPEASTKKYESEAVTPNLPASFQTLLQGEIFQENVQPSTTEDFHLAYEDSHMTLETSPGHPPVLSKEKQITETVTALNPATPVAQRTPKRVQLITLSSPHQKQ